MLTYATESINFQGDRFFKSLVDVVTRLRITRRYDTDAINDSGFAETVKDYTGMTVRLNIEKNDLTPTAYARVPDFDVNHPFIKPLARNNGTYHRVGDSLNILANLGKEMRGGINLKTGKVSGFYSTIPLDVFITTALLNLSVATSEHIAATLIHEIGHHFSYFEFLGVVAFGSIVVGATSARVMELHSDEERKDVIIMGSTLLGIDSYENDDLDKMVTNPENLHVVMLRNYVSKLYINGTTTPYDYRNSEQVADVFATRHGAGRYLADYITVIGKATFDAATASRGVFTFAETGHVIYSVLKGIGGPAHAITTFYYSAPGVKVYDDPEARIRFIRQQLTNSISETEGMDKARLIRDVEVIDEILKDVEDKRDLITLFWESIPGPARSRRKQEEAAKQLESLLYNDLLFQAERVNETIAIK